MGKVDKDRYESCLEDPEIPAKVKTANLIYSTSQRTF